MKIFIMGTGHMGAWLVEELCLDNEVAVYDTDRQKLKHFIDVQRFTDIKEIEAFQPEMVINAVSLYHTKSAFDQIVPLISEHCILADITSVKTEVSEYYHKHKNPFVSVHPMFGPTFANIRHLANENAIIISESAPQGKGFFRALFERLNLNIYEYSFAEHDKTIAYSLSVPFCSSMVFAACMKKQDAPGTTFRKHMEIAKGLLTENNRLLSDIMFNPHTLEQIEKINSQLNYLKHIIRAKDYEEMGKYFQKIRAHMEIK